MNSLSLVGRHGFTLTDLIFAAGLTSVCVAVALPLVNAAREGSRRVECANRLVEITLGSLQFQEANDRMPPMTTSDGPVGQPSIVNLQDDQNTGALAYILPFIGEQELFDLMPGIATQAGTFLNGDSKIGSFVELFEDRQMSQAANTQFPSVICPSDSDLLDKPVDRMFYTTIQVTDSPNTLFIANLNIEAIDPTAFGRTSYLPTVGGFHVQADLDSRGIDLSLADASGAMRNRLTSIHTDDLGDGSSNTICWGESLGYRAQLDTLFGGNDPGVGASLALYSTSLITGQSWTFFVLGEGMQSIHFGDSNNSLPWLIGSNHVGGSNVTFCDGSVRFISDRTSRGVMTALGCGNDGFVAERSK